MNKASFSASEVFPVKVLHDIELLQSLMNGRVLLRHLQLCPTNKCNLNCDYCSCGDRNENIEWPVEYIQEILNTAKKYGCRGVTITGGGEPLLYDAIHHIVVYSSHIGIKVGIVTNGTVLDNIPWDVSWCRVSFDSVRKFESIEEGLKAAIAKYPRVDWSFSFVANAGLGDLYRMVEFANEHDFTHVRVVSDILNPHEPAIDSARSALAAIDERVIYQSRNTYTFGNPKCLISLLKPTVAADGNIYPCCGAQYAIRGSKRDFTEQMSMGKDLADVMENQKYFDGSKCEVCYYENYNSLLNSLMGGIDHPEWV